MKGKYCTKEVQEINCHAYFCCKGHSLKFSVNNAANYRLKVTTFFQFNF